jgi:hypothetical protein
LIFIGTSGKELNTLLLGELCKRNPPQTVVKPNSVVALAPFRTTISGLWQALKKLLTQAFVSKLFIENLDAVVVHEKKFYFLRFWF